MLWQLLLGHAGTLTIRLPDHSDGILLLQSDQKLLDTTLTDVDCCADEATPFDNCVLEPCRHKKSTTEHDIESDEESILFPKIFVLENSN